MGQVTDSVTAEIQKAMKSGDKVRLSTLRMLATALSYEKIAQQKELTDDEELAVIRSEAKKRKDAAAAYEKAGVADRAETEKAELAVLSAYLPADMGETELTKIIEETITSLGAKEISEMGRVIGAVMGKVAGRADGKKVADLVRSKLSGSTS